MNTQVVYKLKDYREALVFEKEHPKSIRWDDKYKLWMLEEEPKCQGLWLRDKKSNKLVAELITKWQSSNVVEGQSFTVLKDYQGQGLGTQLATETLKWANSIGFQWFLGEARMGPSWKIFENLGAEPLLKYENWCNTKEAYLLFKINLTIWQS